MYLKIYYFFFKRVDCIKKIFKLSLMFLVLSLTDVEREGSEREREEEREEEKERKRERAKGIKSLSHSCIEHYFFTLRVRSSTLRTECENIIFRYKCAKWVILARV